MPNPADLDVGGLDMPAAKVAQLLSVDSAGWLAEVPLIKAHFAKFGSRLPKGLHEEVAKLETRLKAGS
jgi:phosphoenolpyruvate carboxykinase (GTP)